MHLLHHLICLYLLQMNLIHLYHLRVNPYVIPTIITSLYYYLFGFWAAQTSAAIINFNIGTTESLVKPAPSPTKAASTIQQMHRRYRTHRQARAVSTIQKWFRSHQYKPSHCTTDISVLTDLIEYPTAKWSRRQIYLLYRYRYLLGYLHAYDIGKDAKYGKYGNKLLNHSFSDNLGISASIRQRRVYCYRFCWG